MPDFDTRTPQEPDQPNRLHMFVVASKQHISAVGRWTGRIMIRHWRLGLSVSFLAVLAVVLTAWAVRTHSEQVDGKLDWAVETPSEHLDQEIRTSPTPAYQLYYEASSLYESSSASDCVLAYQGHYDGYDCIHLITKASDPEELASITQELRAEPSSGTDVAMAAESDFAVVKVWFRRSELADAHATSYCFGSKDLAADALRGKLHKAEMVGKTDDCFVIVYEGSGPALRDTSQ